MIFSDVYLIYDIDIFFIDSLLTSWYGGSNCFCLVPSVRPIETQPLIRDRVAHAIEFPFYYFFFGFIGVKWGLHQTTCSGVENVVVGFDDGRSFVVYFRLYWCIYEVHSDMKELPIRKFGILKLEILKFRYRHVCYVTFF